MQKTMKRVLNKAVLVLVLLSLSIPALSLAVFAEDGISLSADRSSVKAGDPVQVTVNLTGEAIWAYQIDLSANGMFAGDKTVIEDHDGSSSAAVTFTVYAVAPGAGEIYAEASYSDGETLIPLKEAVLKIPVAEGDPEQAQGAAKAGNPGGEGTGGQAVAGQVINGQVVHGEPNGDPDGSDSGNKGANVPKQQEGAEKEFLQESGNTEQKQTSVFLWIGIGILAVLLIAGGCVFGIKKKGNCSKPGSKKNGSE